MQPIPMVTAIGVPPQDEEAPPYCEGQIVKKVSSSWSESSEGRTTAFLSIDGECQQRSNNSDNDAIVRATLVHDFGQGQFKNGTLKKYQDIFWAALFYLHLFAIAAVQRYGNYVNLGVVAYRPVVLLVVLASVTAVVLATLTLGWLQEKAVLIVRIASTFNILSSLAIAIFGCEIGDALVWVLGSLAFAISCCYALTGKRTDFEIVD
jgi:hypothetical protein